jgi:hypothetical protein
VVKVIYTGKSALELATPLSVVVAGTSYTFTVDDDGHISSDLPTADASALVTMNPTFTLG